MTEGEKSDHPLILLVESDILVRMPIAAYLRECGYRVIEAIDGNEAMTVLRESTIAPQVILTETASGSSVDGFSLARWVRQNRPQVQVIISGSPAKAAAEAGKLCDENPRASKPYDHQLVERQIRQLLARGGKVIE